jgi:hypothetical protein
VLLVLGQPEGLTEEAQLEAPEVMKVRAEAQLTFAHPARSTTELPLQLVAAERVDSLVLPEVLVAVKPERQELVARGRAAKPEPKAREEMAVHQMVEPGVLQAALVSAEPEELVPQPEVVEVVAVSMAAEVAVLTSMPAAQTVEVAAVAHHGTAQL